jgi:outer membrane protein OmpA-like peptidoglycan-associated protein
MRKISTHLFQSSLLLLCLNTSAFAREVKMFDYLPSAEEMGKIIFSKSRTGGKTRSIKLSKVDTVGLPIGFSFNSAGILDQSIPFIDEIGEMLILEKFSSEKLVVEGHTDASGPQQYNYHLSERRAHAVKKYLIKRYQISPKRLFVAAQGEKSPLQGKNPFDGVNRRVQFYRAP